jgi:phosphatidylglycerol lysyltransferase
MKAATKLAGLIVHPCIEEAAQLRARGQLGVLAERFRQERGELLHADGLRLRLGERKEEHVLVGVAPKHVRPHEAKPFIEGGDEVSHLILCIVLTAAELVTLLGPCERQRSCHGPQDWSVCCAVAVENASAAATVAGTSVAAATPMRWTATPDASGRERLLALLRRQGWNATSFQALEAGFRYWFDGDDACVAYVETPGAWVAAGAPVASPARLAAVVHGFAAAARAAGKRWAFFAAESRLVDAAALPATQIGEQPTWDPRRWSESLSQSKSLREQLRRARAKGVTVRRLAANEVEVGKPQRLAIEALVDRWLHAKQMAPMGFLVDVQPFAFADERRYFVAERDGVIVGFLAAVPIFARNGWLLEDFLRDPAAPNGTAELLIDAAMRALADEGSEYVTMGLAPLSGPVAGWLRAARRLSAALYDFAGLRAFKAKLRPHDWEPIFLAHGPGTSSHVALVDALAAFARGSFVRFGGATLLRGPAVVVRVLAALLVPWTFVLASAPARWFPWPWVKSAWTALDAVLIVTLFSLTWRWRHWLGVAVAAAITVDACVTTAQVALYNAPRAHQLSDWIAMTIALFGPALAAVVLWGAVGHRRGASAH